MAKTQYDIQYMRANCRVYRLQLNKQKDADLIELLDGRNVNGFLKAVLREYIKHRDLYGEELMFGIEKGETE